MSFFGDDGGFASDLDEIAFSLSKRQLWNLLMGVVYVGGAAAAFSMAYHAFSRRKLPPVVIASSRSKILKAAATAASSAKGSSSPALFSTQRAQKGGPGSAVAESSGFQDIAEEGHSPYRTRNRTRLPPKSPGFNTTPVSASGSSRGSPVKVAGPRTRATEEQPGTPEVRRRGQEPRWRPPQEVALRVRPSNVAGHDLYLPNGEPNDAVRLGTDRGAYDASGKGVPEPTPHDVTLLCLPARSPPGRVDAAMAVAEATGDVYVYGGEGRDGFFDDLYVFRQHKRRWYRLPGAGAGAGATTGVKLAGRGTRRGTLAAGPGPRGSAAGVAAGGAFFVFGGESHVSAALGDLWALSTATGRWSAVTGAGRPGMLNYNGAVDFEDDGSGDDGDDGGRRGSDDGSSEAETPPPRRGATLALWRGTVLVLFGGAAADGTLLSDVWAIDIAAVLLAFGGTTTNKSDGAATSGGADNGTATAVAAEEAASTAGDAVWERLWPAPLASPLPPAAAGRGGGSTPATFHVPAGRRRHGSIVHGDRLLVLGGVGCSEKPRTGSKSTTIAAAAALAVAAAAGGDDDDVAVAVAPAGEIEVFDLVRCTWMLVPANGAAPALTAASAHLLAPNRAVVVSDAAAGLFNAVSVLELGGRLPAWSPVRLRWRGDWTMVPGRRRGYCAAADAAGGAVFVFGGDAGAGLIDAPLLALDCSVVVRGGSDGSADDDGEDGGTEGGDEQPL